MDWSRAKTILIIALIITNVFLLVIYGDFNFRAAEFRDHKALANFLSQNHNIFVDPEIIPAQNRDMPVLFVQSLEKDHDEINRVLQSIVIEDGRPAYIEDEFLEVMTFSTRKQATISAAQALLLFLARIEHIEHNAKDIVIRSIEMIYWLDETGIDIEEAVADTAFPTWKITYGGEPGVWFSRVMHIHAFAQ